MLDSLKNQREVVESFGAKFTTFLEGDYESK